MGNARASKTEAGGSIMCYTGTTMARDISRHTTRTVFAFVILVGLLSFAVTYNALFSVAFILLCMGVYVLSYHLELGFYVMIALSMMTGWQLNLADYYGIFRDYPALLSINAPVADFWVVFLLVAFSLQYFRQWIAGKRQSIVTPGLLLYAFFLLSALVSLVNIPVVERGEGINYLFRFLVFLYVGYIVLGVNICRDKQTLLNGLKILAGVGVFAAIMGIVSLPLGLWTVGGFTRAVPFGILGWSPFGNVHILIAEVLTTTLPIAVFFYVQSEKKNKTAWAISAALMLITAVLTLSRAAILTIGVEACLLAYLFRKKIKWERFVAQFSWVLGLLAIPMFYAAYFILTNPTVEASQDARSHLTGIAIYLFREHPFIGQGVGSFLARLAEVDLFRLEFGDPLEAHGVVQKILAEQGLFGLVTFSVFVGYIFWRLYQRYQQEQYSIEARMLSLLGFFLVLSPAVFQLFNTQYYSSKMWIPIMLAMAQFTIYKTDKKHGKVFHSDRKPIVAEV